MGCGASTEGGAGQSGARNDDPPIEPILVPDIDLKYPPPTPPPNGKADIYRPDDHTAMEARIRKLPPRQNQTSYDSLLKVVTADCRTDLEKARAIFVWLYLQDVEGSFYSQVTDPHTPRGYMKLIKARKGSYESFFALLCRAAGIPCNVIRGLGKGDHYQVGQQDVSDLETAWCSVFVAGGWRLVHPLWAYFQEKQTYKNGLPEYHDKKRPSINEFFWLIDPNRMICFCKPQLDPWQLLKIRWELHKFVRSPLFTEDYFGSGLLLPKKTSGIIATETGVCLIEFDHHKSDLPALEVVVDFDPHMSRYIILSEVNMTDYTAVACSSTKKTIIVRFPVRGRYVAQVFGGRDSRRPKLVEFRLDCEDIGRDPQPFPEHPAEGFGMRPVAGQFGIFDPIPDSGLILVRPHQQKYFSFTSSQPLEVLGRLTHRKYSSDNLTDFVSTAHANGQYNVIVSIPDEPQLEFSLQIWVRPERATRDMTQIASYLLVDENWRKKTAVVTPRQAKVSKNDEERVRKALVAATQKNDVAKLERAIGDFEQHNLSDNGDLTRARNKLLQLHLQNLRRRTLDRKLEELELAIDSAKKSHVYPQLSDSKELADAESTRLQLRRLKLYMHKVLALNKATISEMHSYQRPRPLVHQVMKATFRILGEPNTKLKDWSYVQTSMRQLGRNSMLNRMKRCDVVHLKQRQVEDAEDYLKDTNKHLVRMCSAGAGSFYVWSNNMISEYNGNYDYDPIAVEDTTTKWNRGTARLKDNPISSRMSDEQDSPRVGQSQTNNIKPTRVRVKGDDLTIDPKRYSDHWEPSVPLVDTRRSRD